MSKELNAIARAARAEFSDKIVLKFKLSMMPSFVALRVEDPEGMMTVRDMTDLVRYVGQRLRQNEYVKDSRPRDGFDYHMGGVVANWPIH